MNKFLNYNYCFLFLIITVLTGCAAFRYQIGSKDLGRGYVVSRNRFVIPEYTIGKDGKAPQDKKIAEARFKRRRHAVDYYYKQMGYLFHEPMQFVRTFRQGFSMPFKLPGAVIDEYKYETDKEYRQMIDKQEEELDKKEQARIAKWQVQLDEYIKKDLEKEELLSNASPEKK